MSKPNQVPLTLKQISERLKALSEAIAIHERLQELAKRQAKLDMYR